MWAEPSQGQWVDPAGAWTVLYDKDWTLSATAAGASAPGALTLDGVVGTVINPGSAFLAPSAGIGLELGKGIRVDTTGCTTGPNGNLFGNLSGGWAVPFTTLLAAALWPNTQPGPEAIYSELALVAECDFSGVATNGEGGTVGMSNNTTFGFGTDAGVVRVSGVNTCFQACQGATFATSGSSPTLVGIPGAVVPDSVCVTHTTTGGASFWGLTPGGVRSPTSWYSRDQHMASMLLNNPVTAGGYIRNAGYVYVNAWDTGKTAVVFWVKRWTLYGRNARYRLPMNIPNSQVIIAA